MHQIRGKESFSSIDEVFEETEVTVNNLETFLEEDATFIEFFNAYLALPMFPVRLHYNADTGCFEEFKHKLADDSIDNNAKQATSLKRFSFFKSTIDDQGFKIGYYVKFLEKDKGYAWVKENRLPLFLKSELYAEYKLARILSLAQTEYLMNILIDSINSQNAPLDEQSSPAYRVQRNHGRLPGLAEFQKQLQNMQEEIAGENGNYLQECSSESESNTSDIEVIEFSKISNQDFDTINDEMDKKPAILENETSQNNNDSFRENSISEHSNHFEELEKPSNCLDASKLEKFQLFSVVGSLKSKFEHIKEAPEVAFEADKDMRDNSLKSNESDRMSQDAEDILDDRTCENIPVEKIDALNENDFGLNSEGQRPVTYLKNRLSEDNLRLLHQIERDHQTETIDKFEMRLKKGSKNLLSDWVEEVNTAADTTVSMCKPSNMSDEVTLHESIDLFTDKKKRDEQISATLKQRKRFSLPTGDRLRMKQFTSQESFHSDDVRKHNHRRLSTPFAAFVPLLRKQSSASIVSTALQQMSKLLAKKSFELKDKSAQDTLLSLYEDSDSEDDSGFNDLTSKHPRKHIDVASKLGMDAFKMFLIDTPGEKYFLLWVEIERLKCCNKVDEKCRIMQEIRQRFFRSGAAYEIPTETLKGWNILKISDIDQRALLRIQHKVLHPIKSYWCARFTLHQKHKRRSQAAGYIGEDHSCIKPRCSTHQREMTGVPQRPNTCFSSIRTRRRSKNADMANNDEERQNALCLEEQDSQGADCLSRGSSRTRNQIRSKSAYPRLINTSSPKAVNLSQKQLQIVTTVNESCGYKSSPYCTYKNDATNAGEKAYVRLYIQPMPPADCNATTIVRAGKKATILEKDKDNSLMDSLVECLLHEKHSGGFFARHLQSKNDLVALDCYNFWKAVQEYSEHFFSDSFSPNLIKQKAGLIYNTYIINGSEHCIKCDDVTQKEIHKTLDPPYEDLFDKAEQHALDVLASCYKEIFFEENGKFEELERKEKLKYLDVRTKLRRPKHRPNERVENKDIEEEDSREKISVEEVNSPLPLSADGVTFDAFVRNKVDLESFKEFLEHVNSKGLKDLLAWTEMENFRRSNRRNNQRDNLAKSVHSNWLTNEYFFGQNSPATKQAQEEVKKLANEPEIPERPPSPLILEAQKYVRARIERRWFILFKETSVFQNKHKENNINEMVEDLIMKRRLQRSEAAWKILNSRWISGSRDVVALRKVLMEPTDCQKFRKFLSLKGELMESNVYFWLEVQKYKELCHRHVEDSIIKSKVQAVIDVFIKSAVPPELQIDVPIEIAERLYEKTTGRAPQNGPYLFREAQTTVFRIMFNHWKEYVAFRASIEESKFSQHLEELVKKRKAEVRAKRMNSERRRLAKVAYDKRKKEKEETERFRGKDKMRMDNSSSHGYEKALSLISEDDEAVLQTKSFSYSKLTIEEQLCDFEQRMREEGCTFDEFTEADLTQSHLTSDKKSHRRTSVYFGEDQRSVSGISNRTARKKSDIVSKMNTKESLFRETILESPENLLSGKLYLKVDKRGRASKVSSAKTVDIKGKNGDTHLKESSPNANLNARKKVANSKLLNGHEKVVFSEGISTTSETSVFRHSKSQMPGPQRTGTTLTMKSLKEFEKSSEGKPLGASLPLINITSLEKARGPSAKERRHGGNQRTHNFNVGSDMTINLLKNEKKRGKKEDKRNALIAKIVVT